MDEIDKHDLIIIADILSISLWLRGQEDKDRTTKTRWIKSLDRVLYGVEL
jgi:hypothetical protein